MEERDIDYLQYSKLVFAALHDNKAEIVLKHRLFFSASGINDIITYLKSFSFKQINFACKNDVINALPIIKGCGLYEIEVLKHAELIMRRNGWRHSVYELLKSMFRQLNFDVSDIDWRLVHFLRKTKLFNLGVYADYVNVLSYRRDVTVEDFFDKNYIQRHEVMVEERGRRRCSQNEKEEYALKAQELSWIDREENGYFIIVPKSIEDFRVEGDIQHICVYSMGYYRHVINNRSIIVFIRTQKDVPYVTVELDYATFEVLQARRKYNQSVDEQLSQYIFDLSKRLYFEKISQQ